MMRAGDVQVGDEVFVSRRIGWQKVVEIEEYLTLGLEAVECVVICWESFRGEAWENRAGCKNQVSTYKRDHARMRPMRLDEPVEVVKGSA